MSHSAARDIGAMELDIAEAQDAAPSPQSAAAEVFPVEKLASVTPEGAAAFRDQSSVLRAAALIRDMREAAGFTQRELAKRVGTTQPHLSELERGTGAQGPTFMMLENIATACGRVLRVEIGVKDAAMRQDAPGVVA